MTQTVASRGTAGRIALLFAVGFIAVVLFQQLAWFALLSAGIVPATAYQLWSFEPIPPFGVPSLISKGFWGGLWAIALGTLLAGQSGWRYWAGWVAISAVAITAVFLFVVTPLKGLQADAPLAARFAIGAIVNAVWGAACAFQLAIMSPRRTLG
jgi:hypothetical protein